MKVAFRADASVALGSGHVMRCLTLADRLHAEGAACRFVCRQEQGHLGDVIAARGHELTWLSLGTDGDAADSARALADAAPWDWLVVDHYGLAAGWERQMRTLARKIMVIDDLADRPHDCDLLLDQNLQGPGRYARLVPEACRILAGPHYALLRPEFAAVRRALPERGGKVSRLLVFFGGSDPHGQTLKALSAIRALDRPELSLDVVIGGSNPKPRAIEAVCAGMPNTALHVQVEDMARRMGDADLFVGAGGTASWERCCVGLPALVMATADNQLEQCQALARAGAHLYLGAADTVSEARLTRVLECALEMPDSLAHLGARGMSLVDGRGADRVAHHLLAVTVWLRRAVAADSAVLFEWRNDPETRRYALSSKPIPRESHERWFAEVLKDSRRDLLIAESGGRPLGVLRYDIDGERALVSVYLVPGLAGRGWGRRILLAGEAWLREQRPEVRRCEAEIKADNAASRASFEAIGFRPKRTLFGKDIDGRQ